MTILRKPLAEIAIGDLDQLVANGTRETSELEFKGALPFERVKGQTETADRWVTRGDRVGDFARDRIISELIAFANAEGGTFILGVEETTGGRAAKLEPLPRCEELRKRLADACEDVIEPRLPILETHAVRADDGEAGYVLMRVARSGTGPHRLTSDGQFYIRRRDRSEKMTVREIRDAVLDLARRGDVVSELFKERQREDRAALEHVRFREADPSVAQVLLLRVTAIPSTQLSIPNLTERSDLWWIGDEHVVKINGRDERLTFPAREFNQPPRVAMRLLRYAGDRVERTLAANGRTEIIITITREPQPGKVLSDIAPLYLPWAVAMMIGVLAQVEHLRRKLAIDGTEFGIQFGAEATHPAIFGFGGDYGGSLGREARLDSVDFPILPVGPAATFDDVITLMVRDLANHFGATKTLRIEADWQGLLGG